MNTDITIIRTVANNNEQSRNLILRIATLILLIFYDYN